MRKSQKRPTFTELCIVANEAIKREAAARAENHRTYKLCTADPEWHQPQGWFNAKTLNLRPGTPEHKAYAAIRNAWDDLIVNRHGYGKTSAEWNTTIEALRLALNRFFTAPAKHPAEIQAKTEIYEKAAASFADDSPELLSDARAQLLRGIKADLQRACEREWAALRRAA